MNIFETIGKLVVALLIAWMWLWSGSEMWDAGYSYGLEAGKKERNERGEVTG